ncbi:MAG: M24 family metallopeptidase [Verrucomicrobia bacterium]|nr:M24 family metallopeptidase [Verrucomicrobiota bacterium]NDB76325.1 M24 family metallopeptidase [Verrucomicrobiota bacterium]NDD39378.1 M24 family metallopeptidase [Verrucomicrobiota bacterium]NDE99327.1 M24 family metallopeptidase [Verrucomicrobiota bacterium]
MRHAPIDSKLFTENRERLKKLLPPKSLAIINANDVLPTNADGTLMMHPNSDLFYLSGIEQEESILLLAPDAHDPKHREILFLREPSEHLKIWEGHKHTKDAATKISGVKQIKWLSEFPVLFRILMCELEHVWLNSNEHKRAHVEVETRDARFARECQAKFPLHNYHRLARLMHPLRVVKTEAEIKLLQQAVDITAKGFRRLLKFVKPGVNECEVEAELAHEFIRNRAKFAYNPIIASGGNACVLHYNQNDQPCKKGELLLDVAASYANYNADLTRTIPVSGRFTRRQKAVYNAVLRVMRASIKGATVGKLTRDWQKESQLMMNEELLSLGLITKADIRKQTEDELACRKYFMHGLGHPLGLDVHDVGFTTEPFAAGWVLTVEPGIYIPKEGFAVRLENDIVVTPEGPVDLMAKTPVEAEEIEDLMNR